MNVLVVNCGSSSVKFQVIATDKESIAKDSDRRLARGIVERVGSLSLITFSAEGRPPHKDEAPLKDHRAAVDRIIRWLVSEQARIPGVSRLADIHAVGHRVVHGGERFKASTFIDAKVVAGIEDCVELAPLHNPANLKGIRAARELFGSGVPQVAVFDTAFHSAMPETAYLYGIPYQLYRRHKIRRYGFHGTSHRYVAYRYRRMLGLAKDKVDVISVHLGNGCSACAIKKGVSVNTSMGFTPLEGLLMGTRSGDIDASIVEYLSLKEGMSLSEIDGLLNKQSGLLGLSGLTGDMRDLLAEVADNRDRRAGLAIDIFCARVRRYIGAYFADMGGAQAVLFTGGIGENSPEIRRRVCAGLDCLGLKLDARRNETLKDGGLGAITKPSSALKAYVIPTDEELLIARDACRVVSGLPLPG
ncbi:MAG: acetate kinase [Elusimicrobia bacterium]|nr:acetate kinase [Elusimicrobiota bacterium]